MTGGMGAMVMRWALCAPTGASPSLLASRPGECAQLQHVAACMSRVCVAVVRNRAAENHNSNGALSTSTNSIAT